MCEELLDEVKFLRFYMERAYNSFGPADADIDHMIKEEYEERTGSKVPFQYRDEEDESS